MPTTRHRLRRFAIFGSALREMIRRPATRAATLLTRRWSSTTPEIGWLGRTRADIAKWITLELGGQVAARHRYARDTNALWVTYGAYCARRRGGATSGSRRATRTLTTRSAPDRSASAAFQPPLTLVLFFCCRWYMHKSPRRHIRHFVTWGYSAATQRILFPDLALIFGTSSVLTAYNFIAEAPIPSCHRQPLLTKTNTPQMVSMLSLGPTRRVATHHASAEPRPATLRRLCTCLRNPLFCPRSHSGCSSRSAPIPPICATTRHVACGARLSTPRATSRASPFSGCPSPETTPLARRRRQRRAAQSLSGQLGGEGYPPPRPVGYLRIDSDAMSSPPWEQQIALDHIA